MAPLDPDSDEFLKSAFLQDLNNRCRAEVRELWESSGTAKEFFARMGKHKFSFRLFTREWLAEWPRRKPGRERLYDDREIAQRWLNSDRRNMREFIRREYGQKRTDHKGIDRHVKRLIRALKDLT